MISEKEALELISSLGIQRVPIVFGPAYGNAVAEYDIASRTPHCLIVDPTLLLGSTRVFCFVIAHEAAHFRHPEHFDRIALAFRTDYDSEIEADTEGAQIILAAMLPLPSYREITRLLRAGLSPKRRYENFRQILPRKVKK